jgi:hypothetical protein
MMGWNFLTFVRKRPENRRCAWQLFAVADGCLKEKNPEILAKIRDSPFPNLWRDQ